MPPRVDAPSPGCLAAMLGYSALCVLLFWLTQSLWWLAFAMPGLIGLVMVVAYFVWGRILLAAGWRFLQSRGIRCVVIYSDSPTCDEYIRSRWLPRLGRSATSLNWSQRSAWPISLEVLLFKRFVGSWDSNFNPAVLVLRGLRQPLVFRFYHAFEQSRHGRRQYLETLEAEMFEELGM